MLLSRRHASLLHHEAYAFTTPTRTTKFLLLKLFRDSKKLSDRHAEHVAHQARDRGISLVPSGPFNEASEMPRLRSARRSLSFFEFLNSFSSKNFVVRVGVVKA